MSRIIESTVEPVTDPEVDLGTDCPCCRDAGRLDDDGTRVTVREMELYVREDWEGLIALRTRILDRHGEDPYCHLRLAEAYAIAGRHGESLEAAARGHALDPHEPWIQDAVLHALFALGRSEEDFEWRAEPPPVLRLDEALMERIERRLEEDDRSFDGYRGIVELGMIYHELQDEGYLPFGPDELLTAVRADPRFVIDGEPGRPYGSYFLTQTYDGSLEDRQVPASA